jgi:hypothetical protein
MRSTPSAPRVRSELAEKQMSVAAVSRAILTREILVH